MEASKVARTKLAAKAKSQLGLGGSDWGADTTEAPSSKASKESMLELCEVKSETGKSAKSVGAKSKASSKKTDKTATQIAIPSEPKGAKPVATKVVKDRAGATKGTKKWSPCVFCLKTPEDFKHCMENQFDVLHK